MNSVQRVCCAINKELPDRVPRGEFWLDASLLEKIFPGEKELTRAQEICAFKKLGLDLRAICPEAAVNSPGALCRPSQADFAEIAFWRKESDLFLFALLDGVFQGVSGLMEFTDFMLAIARGDADLGRLIAKQAANLTEQAEMAVLAGAHGILIGEDMAYNSGPYISPDSLRRLFFPALKEAVRKIKSTLHVPVFLHSDGNLNAVFNDIVEMGFDGLQGIEAQAGMDIAEIKKQHGRQLCLMGNLDVGFLAAAKSLEVYEAGSALMQTAGADGGFILGSSAGILHGDIPLANLLALKDAVSAYPV